MLRFPVLRRNLDRVIEEDPPSLRPGEVSVIFDAAENATLGFPSLYYSLHATICWSLLSQTPFSIMSGIICSAAGPSGNHTLNPGRVLPMQLCRDHLSASVSMNLSL